MDAVRADSPRSSIPGRLERVRNAPTVFLDAAHNPHGAQALAAALADEFDFRKLVGVVSVDGGQGRGRDHRGAFEPVFDEIVVTHNGSPRAMDVERLAKSPSRSSATNGSGDHGYLPDAVETAIGWPRKLDDTGEAVSGAGVVVTGSVVTAGAARTLFGKEPA